MRVKILESVGGSVLELDAALVIVEDAAGNPINVACECNGGYTCETADNTERFNRILKVLGLDRSVVCDSIKTATPPKGSSKLIL